MRGSARKTKRRSIIINTTLVVATLLVGALVSEAAVRLLFHDKFGKRPGFIITDGELGWKPNRDLDHTFYGADFDIAIRTDKDGYRLGELGEVDYGRELVILCGDSYVFGWGVSTDETMASHLDRCVNERSSGSHRVVNLGVGGYGTLQYYYRLMDFLKKHPAVSISAVVVMHSDNDATDNLKSLGSHIGAWKVKTRESAEKSPSHLVNLFRYGMSVLQRKLEGNGRQPRGRPVGGGAGDILFSYEYEESDRIEYPPVVDFDGRKVYFTDVSNEDYYTYKLMERESMTRIQGELIQVGAGFIHKMLGNSQTKVIHLMIPTMNDWYMDELIPLLLRTPDLDEDRVLIARGRFPDPGGFAGRLFNEHSGGHYTEDFNRFWAAGICDILEQQELLE